MVYSRKNMEDSGSAQGADDIVDKALVLQHGTPYLMLPVRDDCTNGGVRELYSLAEGESIVSSFEIPKLKSSTMCSESLGWLLAVQEDGSMCLVDPLSKTEIPVPHPNTIPEYNKYVTKVESMFVQKMVLSSRPNETSSDFILMVICGHCSNLAFWRSGDESWNWIESFMRGFRDVVYGGGEQFYAIDCQGTIRIINLAAAGNVECRIIVDCARVLRLIGGVQNNLYIVKTINGSLLAIKRSKEQKYYLTSVFEVYEIDAETSTLREVRSLGSMSIFLGRNSSIAVDASKLPRIKPNHIYFTDDFWEFQSVYFKYLKTGDWKAIYSPEAKGGCVDSGVYNMETRVIEPIYPAEPLLSNVSPAMFITPNFSS